MKTSKIKTVVNSKEWSNNGKTIIYHNLEMENGDKINIGKVKLQQVGWELTYEITEQGQQEFNKAKAVQKEQNFTKSFNTQSTKPDNVQDLIVRQSSLKAAIDFTKCSDNSTVDDIFYLADECYNWVMGKKVNTKPENFDGLKSNGKTDMPF